MKRVKGKLIDSTVKIKNSSLGKDSELREYSTIHDSRIGKGCLILERVSVKKSKVGNNVAINAGTYVEFAEIADDVLVGPNSSIVGVYHSFDKRGTSKENLFNKVFIGRKSWIGANVVIKNGVRIGGRCVIGAGSIVTKNVPSGYIAIGAPAKIYPLEKWSKRK
jgi:acetyltransferase-like isoleucine patch superfamily enzyme